MLGHQALGWFALGQITGPSAYALTLELGTFTVSGQDATLTNARVLACAVGTFTLAGQNVGLPVSMPAEVGAYTLTGQTATLQATRTMTAEVGSYTIDGYVTFVVSMPAEVGSYTLTGQGSTLVKGYSINCEPFPSIRNVQFGFAALGEVAIGQSRVSEGNTFSIAGQSLSLSVNMPADAGSYIVTGSNVIQFNRVLRKFRAFTRVGHGTVSARSVGRDIKARSYGG